MPKGDFYNTLNVLAQLKTEPRALQLASTTNATVTASAVAIYATTTVPTASGRTASHWIRTEGMTYMKIMPFIASTATSPAIRIIGWDQHTSSGLYVPQILCDLSITLTANDNTINSASLRQARSFTKNNGDAKLFNSDATHLSGAFALIDTCGCGLIEIHYRAASVSSSPAANMFYSSL
jgi:hypothetical protein